MHSLLKNIKLIICLSAMMVVAGPGPSYCQTIWNWRSDSLDNAYSANKISSPQWWWAFRETAGSIGVTQVWVKDTGNISPAFVKASGDVPSPGGVRLYIAQNGQVNKHGEMTVYLLNNSNSDITIPRHDATVDYIAVKEEVYTNSRWMTLHDNFLLPGCGNGRFTGRLQPGRYLTLESSSRDDSEGNVSAMYRIALTVSGRVVTSNAVKVRLFQAQLARITDENPINPPKMIAQPDRALKTPVKE